ncbi:MULTISPECIES: hypothetical protein [Halomonadaceae]|uniref:hypothetical protein n=1 Tax=Halomonadaceae TaxID=28256 RepID=UPI00159A16B5|nr:MULTISPECIES: hypothetical protein [Halomonas]QJQ94699.1 hypothetical protein HIO72_04985 [Halomonas sp. PA5]
MSKARARWIMIAEILLLLLPLTLLMGLLVPLTYVAYPIPDPRPILIVFDIGMLFKLIGIAAAWRLALAYLRQGGEGLRKCHSLWFVLLIVAVAIGLASTLVAIEQSLFSTRYEERIGFTLLAPALLLAPLAGHLLHGRRKAR